MASFFFFFVTTSFQESFLAWTTKTSFTRKSTKRLLQVSKVKTKEEQKVKKNRKDTKMMHLWYKENTDTKKRWNKSKENQERTGADASCARGSAAAMRWCVRWVWRLCGLFALSHEAVRHWNTYRMQWSQTATVYGVRPRILRCWAHHFHWICLAQSAVAPHSAPPANSRDVHVVYA